jgi:hypothetical protein
MSTLWTPGGEHPVDRPGSGPADETASGSARPAAGPTAEEAEAAFEALTPEEKEQVRAMQAEMADARARLLETPAGVVIANHAMGLYELGAIHLTAERPQLTEASLAIDALAAIIDSVGDRLGEPLATLKQALSQLRAAYVQVHSATADEPG